MWEKLSVFKIQKKALMQYKKEVLINIFKYAYGWVWDLKLTKCFVTTTPRAAHLGCYGRCD